MYSCGVQLRLNTCQVGFHSSSGSVDYRLAQVPSGSTRFRHCVASCELLNQFTCRVPVLRFPQAVFWGDTETTEGPWSQPTLEGELRVCVGRRQAHIGYITVKTAAVLCPKDVV